MKLRFTLAPLLLLVLTLALGSLPGCKEDGGGGSGAVIDPTGEWDMVFTTDGVRSNCPLTFTNVPIIGRITVGVPSGISDSAEAELTLDASQTFIQTLIEDVANNACIPFAFGYSPNTASASVSNFLGQSFNIALPSAVGTASCDLTPATADVSITFTSETAGNGALSATGAVSCGVSGTPLTASNSNCLVWSDIVASKIPTGSLVCP